jgi:hypothetical protein
MPQPGAPMPTGFLYIEVLPSDITQKTPNFTNFASPEPYMSIEHFLKGRCIGTAAKKDFYDSTRVYRFPNTAFYSFPKNPCDETQRFLPVANKRFIVLDSDPSAGKTAKTALWTPIG